MEQKPHKKEELMVANSVLKLAEDLLKVAFHHSRHVTLHWTYLHWSNIATADPLQTVRKTTEQLETVMEQMNRKGS